MAAIKSSPECSASERMPRLPVATARNTFSPTRTKAEPIDPSAAICFTELGDRVMGNPRKDYTMPRCGKRGAELRKHLWSTTELAVVDFVATRPFWGRSILTHQQPIHHRKTFRLSPPPQYIHLPEKQTYSNDRLVDTRN